MTRLLRASNNAAIVLGRELGRGGEGAVYPVQSAPDLVAKIYLKLPTPLKAEKLRSMARRASPALLRVAAWPVDVIADGAGNVRGFLMPKVSAREDVHELYSPKSRRRAFPSADFRFVVRVAANIARAFAQVHAIGHVVGDVNHGNALVGRDGTVVLIDCDSFQIRDGARHFTCDVGVALFTAPELSGQPFRGLRRTANHDAFGLAVLIFHLLYLGRHPFAGKYSGGEMPIERAIAESRFVYGKNAAAFGMTPPPGTLALGSFGERIARQFEQAFAAPSDAPRPAAAHWVDALQALEADLVECGEQGTHYHRRGDPGGGGGCCWCGVERSIGVRLFGAKIAGMADSGAARLASLWDSITSIPKPPSLSPMEVPPAEHLASESIDPLGRVPRIVLSGVLGVLGAGCLLYQSGPNFILGLMCFAGALGMYFGHKMRRFEGRGAREFEEGMREKMGAGYVVLATARKELSVAINRWNSIAHDQRFDKLLEELVEAKRRLLELPEQRAARRKVLLDDAAKRQRDRYLDQFRIDKAKLKKLWPQELMMLASYGIETAEDALRLQTTMESLVLKGTFNEIVDWANHCAAGFRFDPAKDVEDEAVRDFEMKMSAREDLLLNRLKEGEADLRQLAEDIAAQRAETDAQIQAARQALSAAEALRP
jgi:DNA-binding helix-hairpin-helix protein with protein kinase domain